VVNEIHIGDHVVGEHYSVFVIAEAGVNHDGEPDVALRLVDAALKSQADAVKFQTFRAASLASPAAGKASYQEHAADPGETQLQMLERLELSRDDFRTVKAHCDGTGITFLSTPFDEESADFLEELGVPAFKVASGELVNHALLAHLAAKGKPMLVSTGMSDLDEVKAAMRVIRDTGDPPVVLLHCVSSYPANPAEANLRAMRTLAQAFDVPVGFSDHTEGHEVALAAVALGACVIEKHLTLDRRRPGPDHAASTELDEFAQLVRRIRIVERALGSGEKVAAPSEIEARAIARRSLVAARDLAAGTTIESDDILAIRGAGTIEVNHLQDVVGRKVVRDIPAGDAVNWENLE